MRVHPNGDSSLLKSYPPIKKFRGWVIRGSQEKAKQDYSFSCWSWRGEELLVESLLEMITAFTQVHTDEHPRPASPDLHELLCRREGQSCCPSTWFLDLPCRGLSVFGGEARITMTSPKQSWSIKLSIEPGFFPVPRNFWPPHSDGLITATSVTSVVLELTCCL